MNYLAHLFLSPAGEPEVMTGNLMADFVKGSDVQLLPPAVQTGIRLHRAIDAHTDLHPITRRSIARIRERWGRVSGILMDVYYDHILARDWPHLSPQPLRHYLDEAYRQFLPCARALPGKYPTYAERMVAEDLLMSYATPEGIASALARMSRRFCNDRFRLSEALPDLLVHDETLSADFHEFFPELQKFAANWCQPPAN